MRSFAIISIFVILCSYSNSVIFECEFTLINIMNIKKTYKCTLKNLDISHNNETVHNVTGIHKDEKESKDVNILIIENQVCYYLPNDINLHFPQLYHLDIKNSGLKSITKTEMKMFPKLKYLYIRNNPIEIIPENVFEFNPLLEFISLDDNRIRSIGTNVFGSLNNLISLSVEHNICIDNFAMEEEPLKNLIQEINVKCKFYSMQ
ncbi:CLUMA_CG000023, isoform A [Clunio marinus]|uniref:CLUMA_CG000023, isoform A n=1 Tax=Clunio marinus TaxID=568069 RepID=A0A1J1HEN2_9DIPT|nr:CLUMA_CG000023, isoform A [Clunio marinus]